MALDGIVRMVDAFFRHWDDAKKMWSEYERGGFRLVVIGDELPLYPHQGRHQNASWCQGRAGLPRFRLQDLASLGLNVETIKPNGRPAVGIGWVPPEHAD
jgi:hypothetical protein